MNELVVIMVTYHRPNDTRRSIASVLAGTDELRRLVVIENTPTGALDDVLTEAASDPRVTVIRPGRNLGKGLAVRTYYYAIISNCKADHFVNIDADIEVEPEWHPKLLQAAREAGPFAAISPALYDPARPDDPVEHYRARGPETREVAPGVWYNRITGGGLFLIDRAFWEAWGGYRGNRLYGDDDGALVAAAVERNLFIGFTTRTRAAHLNLDSPHAYEVWKRDHIAGPDMPGFWG